MAQEIFVVDDELDIRMLIRDILADEGYSVREFSGSADLLVALEQSCPALVILDIWLKGSDMDGMHLLEMIKKLHPQASVVMISGHGNVEVAVSSIKKGAYDFIEKPFNSDRLLLVVSRALQNARLVSENQSLRYQNQLADEIIGNSGKTNALRHVIDKVAATGSRVLITGPAGVGKEVAARALHNKSDRKDQPFILFNCAGLNSYSLEMELVEAFKKARKGTLVLDEVCDLPLVIQGKLLKLIQDNSSGDADDIRIIAITSQDLAAKIGQGLFREDLYYRLNVVPIAVPPLCERRDDIIILAEYFMQRYCELFSLSFKGFAEQAKLALKSYGWAGNTRQLRNTMEWLAIMLGEKLENSEITLEMLPVEIYSDKKNLVPDTSYADFSHLPLKEAREAFEKGYLETQLMRQGSISKTAAFIGMERTALHRKLKQLGIEYKK